MQARKAMYCYVNQLLFYKFTQSYIMKKILLTCQLLFSVGIISTQAQNLYAIGDTSWINLDDFSKATPPDTTTPVPSDDPTAAPPAPSATASMDFKKFSKYASRFRVVDLNGTPPTSAVYKDRPFRIVDNSHIGYKITSGSREIKVESSKDDEKLDDVKGNNFLVGTSDGIVHVQRFEGDLGYRIMKHDEWGKIKYRTTLPHTNVVETKGTEYKQPFLLYFTHTDRFMVFNSLTSRDIHKTTIVDLKDGKTNEIATSVCGVIRADNEISFDGYVIRDEVAKTLKVNMKGANWPAYKEPNAAKVQAEVLVSDSVFVLARYYRGTAGISLVAFHVKTGKVLWAGEVKQASTAANLIYLSKYQNKLLMECTQAGGNYMEAFDMATGKRIYSSL